MVEASPPALPNPLTPCKRRGFLARLLGVAGALALPGSAVAVATRDPGRFDAARFSLSESESRIASLGRHLIANDPGRAEQLIRWVESQLPLWGRVAAPARRARIARERLLTARRLDRDFERHEVVVIDGWVLARSEAAVAVYLSSFCPTSALGSANSRELDPSTI
jgi:hypothetical protein